MRWKISGHGHDPRQIDLIAICILLIAIIAAFHFYDRNPQPPSKAAFIVRVRACIGEMISGLIRSASGTVLAGSFRGA